MDSAYLITTAKGRVLFFRLSKPAGLCSHSLKAKRSSGDRAALPNFTAVKCHRTMITEIVTFPCNRGHHCTDVSWKFRGTYSIAENVRLICRIILGRQNKIIFQHVKPVTISFH